MAELSDKDVISGMNDVEMIRRVHLWPHAVLPLKRVVDGVLDTAVVVFVKTDGSVGVIENVTIFGELPSKKPERKVFKDAEAVVDAGWKVD